MNALHWVVWPSFLVAGVAETLFFDLIEPGELGLPGDLAELSVMGIYSIGFFFFWGICLASSAATRFFLRPPSEVNRKGHRPRWVPVTGPGSGSGSWHRRGAGARQHLHLVEDCR